ncbi:MAG: ATP-binding protein [Gemmatimonadaceae bacterium]
MADVRLSYELREGRAAPEAAATASAATASAAGTVLVVDDNAAKRYLVARWLKLANFEVLEAEDGETGLQLARTGPDLVVLDVKLPDIGGLEVCRRIKTNPITAHIPVLHLSGHASSSEDRATGLDAGADAYLAHPVDPVELTATVRALLRIRRTELALRASEERYRLVAKATNDVIRDWDLASGEVVWNDAARTVLRFDADAIRPDPQWWYDHVHPEDRERVVAGLRAVTQGHGEHWVDEYRFRRGDGTYATVLDRGFVAHDEHRRPVRIVCSMVDVTERKTAEEAQHLLADASSALATTLDYELALRRVCRLLVPRLADVCAVFLADSVGAHGTRPAAVRLFEACGALEDDERRLRGLYRQLPVNVEDPVDGVARVLRLGAPELCADAAPMRESEPGATLHAMGATSYMILPLRGRERTIGALLLARRGDTRYGFADLVLSKELAGRTALAVENGRLYEEAVVANQAKGDFLAVMSHELRTPLNAVVGYSDLLLLGIAGPVPPQAQQYVGRVQACAKHLVGLIDQILIFSRMEAGREHANLERADARAVARDAAALIEPLAQERGLAFRVEAPAHALSILTDPGKLRQILINLLSNAVKFTERGSVTLAVLEEPDAVVVEVRDSGIGIAPEHVERVFDPFWQVEQKKTRRVGGSGLGLAVARRLASLLGGDLSVRSTPGEGSTFALRLPMPRGELPRPPAEEPLSMHASPSEPRRAAEG